MTISSTASKISYLANGVTIAFAFPYLFLASSDLKVTVSADNVDDLQTITTDYTVSGAGNPSGGTVTFVTAPTNGSTVTILRQTPKTQTTDYVPNDRFGAETHEAALDKLTMAVQEMVTTSGLALRYPDAEPSTSSGILPTKGLRAGKSLGFDLQGQPTLYNIPETYGVYSIPIFKVSDYTADPGDSQLEAAIDELGGTACILYVDVACEINKFVTVPSNIVLFCDANRIEFASGGSGLQGITCQAQILAGRYPIFRFIDETAIGDISLVGEIYPEWFGAVGDNVTDDTQPLSYALGATNYSAIRFNTNKTYMVVSDVTMTRSNAVLDMNRSKLTSIYKIVLSGTGISAINLPPEAYILGANVVFSASPPTSSPWKLGPQPTGFTVNTSDATATTVATIAIPAGGGSGSFGKIEVEAWGIGPSLAINRFQRQFVYQRAFLTTVANGQGVGTDLNPTTLGGLSEVVSSNSVLIRVTGAAATAVEWRVFVKVTPF